MLDIVAALFFLVARRLLYTTFLSALVDITKAFGELVEWIEHRRLGPPSTSLALPVPVRWQMDDEQLQVAKADASLRNLLLCVALPMPSSRGTPSTLAPAAFDGAEIARRAPPALPAPVDCITIKG